MSYSTETKEKQDGALAIVPWKSASPVRQDPVSLRVADEIIDAEIIPDFPERRELAKQVLRLAPIESPEQATEKALAVVDVALAEALPGLATLFESIARKYHDNAIGVIKEACDKFAQDALIANPVPPQLKPMIWGKLSERAEALDISSIWQQRGELRLTYSQTTNTTTIDNSDHSDRSDRRRFSTVDNRSWQDNHSYTNTPVSITINKPITNSYNTYSYNSGNVVNSGNTDDHSYHDDHSYDYDYYEESGGGGRDGGRGDINISNSSESRSSGGFGGFYMDGEFWLKACMTLMVVYLFVGVLYKL